MTKSFNLSQVVDSTGATNVGYTAPFTGAVARTQSSKNAESVSVLDFGADPTGGVDSTSAINAAFAASSRVYFPAGSYKTSSTIVIPQNSTVVGASRNTTFIVPTAAVSVAIAIQPYTGVAQNLNNKISNLTVNMANMPNAATSYGWFMQTSWNNNFQDCGTINAGSSAWPLFISYAVYATEFNNCYFAADSGAGITVTTSGGGNPTTLTFLNCTVNSGTIVLDHCLSIRFIGCVLQSASTKFNITSVTGLLVEGCDLEGSGAYFSFGLNNSDIRSIGNQTSGLTGTYPSVATISSSVGGSYLFNDNKQQACWSTYNKGPIVLDPSLFGTYINNGYGTTASLATGVPANTVNLGGQGGNYIFSAIGNSGGPAWRAVSFVWNSGAALTIDNLVSSHNITIGSSGTTITVTNTNASSMDIAWSISRLL